MSSVRCHLFALLLGRPCGNRQRAVGLTRLRICGRSGTRICRTRNRRPRSRAPHCSGRLSGRRGPFQSRPRVAVTYGIGPAHLLDGVGLSLHLRRVLPHQALIFLLGDFVLIHADGADCLPGFSRGHGAIPEIPGAKQACVCRCVHSQYPGAALRAWRIAPRISRAYSKAPGLSAQPLAACRAHSCVNMQNRIPVRSLWSQESRLNVSTR